VFASAVGSWLVAFAAFAADTAVAFLAAAASLVAAWVAVAVASQAAVQAAVFAFLLVAAGPWAALVAPTRAPGLGRVNTALLAHQEPLVSVVLSLAALVVWKFDSLGVYLPVALPSPHSSD